MYIYLYLGNYRDKNINLGLFFLRKRENVQRQTLFQWKMLLGICVSWIPIFIPMQFKNAWT